MKISAHTASPIDKNLAVSPNGTFHPDSLWCNVELNAAPISIRQIDGPVSAHMAIILSPVLGLYRPFIPFTFM